MYQQVLKLTHTTKVYIGIELLHACIYGPLAVLVLIQLVIKCS